MSRTALTFLSRFSGGSGALEDGALEAELDCDELWDEEHPAATASIRNAAAPDCRIFIPTPADTRQP
jgi:hypothetical protein